MANTTNFNWETPDDTDLVKDGAAAIRTLGSAIDTSLVDLKGGTTGQILSKATGTDMDFTWITNDVGDITAVSAGTGLSGGGTTGAVSLAIDTATTVDVSTAQTLTNKTLTSPVLTTPSLSTIDAKGDLIVGSADNTIARLAVGTNGHVLTADSTATNGIKWAAGGGGSALTLIQRSTFSNVANTGTTFDNIFTSTYKAYQVVIEDIGASTATDDGIFEWLYSGSVQSLLYFAAAGGGIYDSATFQNQQTNNQTKYTFESAIGDATNGTSGVFYFYKVGNTSERPRFTSTTYSNYSGVARVGGGNLGGDARTYTGIRFSSSSSNISGTIAVYGLATA